MFSFELYYCRCVAGRKRMRGVFEVVCDDVVQGRERGGGTVECADVSYFIHRGGWALNRWFRR
jgi:hypothetical protein